jgi:hypothetical protein
VTRNHEIPTLATLLKLAKAAKATPFAKVLGASESKARALRTIERRTGTVVAKTQSLQVAKAAARDAWMSAHLVGSRHAGAELRTLGMKSPQPVSPDESEYLQAIYRSLEEMWALPSTERELRARFAAQVATHRGYNVGAAETYDRQVMRVWSTSFGPNTCDSCASLHGSVAQMGGQFSDMGRPVFQDLETPPRHPNCRCRIVPITEVEINTPGIGPESMRSFGESWNSTPEPG